MKSSAWLLARSMLITRTLDAQLPLLTLDLTCARSPAEIDAIVRQYTPMHSRPKILHLFVDHVLHQRVCRLSHNVRISNLGSFMGLDSLFARLRPHFSNFLRVVVEQHDFQHIWQYACLVPGTGRIDLFVDWAPGDALGVLVEDLESICRKFSPAIEGARISCDCRGFHDLQRLIEARDLQRKIRKQGPGLKITVAQQTEQEWKLRFDFDAAA